MEQDVLGRFRSLKNWTVAVRRVPTPLSATIRPSPCFGMCDEHALAELVGMYPQGRPAESGSISAAVIRRAGSGLREGVGSVESSSTTQHLVVATDLPRHCLRSFIFPRRDGRGLNDFHFLARQFHEELARDRRIVPAAQPCGASRSSVAVPRGSA